MSAKKHDPFASSFAGGKARRTTTGESNQAGRVPSGARTIVYSARVPEELGRSMTVLSGELGRSKQNSQKKRCVTSWQSMAARYSPN